MESRNESDGAAYLVWWCGEGGGNGGGNRGFPPRLLVMLLLDGFLYSTVLFSSVNLHIIHLD